MKALAMLLATNRPLGPILKGVFGVMDCGGMPCATPRDPIPQRALGGLRAAI